jgi:hypothetical protein
MGLLLTSCSSPEIQLTIQAEKFNRGTVVADDGSQGYGQGIGVIVTPKAPAFVEYDLELTRTANYKVEIRYASGVPRPVRLLMDGQLVTDHAADMVTGGFLPDHQKWQEAAVLSLARGKHILRLESESIFPHIDQLKLSTTDRAATSKS